MVGVASLIYSNDGGNAFFEGKVGKENAHILPG